MRSTRFFAFGLLCIASQALAKKTSQAATSSTSISSSTSSSTVAAQTTTASSVIPANISDSCSSFLMTLNTDANIQACTTPLLQATTYYTNATASATSSILGGSTASSVSAQALTDSLGKLCDGTTGCQPQIIRAQLSKFWTACGTELRAKNEAVLDVYDVMYLLNPFHDAVCTQDSAKNYCLLTIANSSAASAATGATTSKRSLLTEDENLLAEKQFDKRQDSTANAEGAMTTAGNANIAFLFLQPNSSKEVLCSDCSKNILAGYIRFETAIPYAIGLANSENLAGQSQLYKAMANTCGAAATLNVNQLAGTTAFATVASSAMSSLHLTPTTLALAAGMALALGGALAL